MWGRGICHAHVYFGTRLCTLSQGCVLWSFPCQRVCPYDAIHVGGSVPMACRRYIVLNRDKIKTLFLLHMMLMIYSMGGICSKKASGAEFLSLRFCIFYGCIIMLLGFYAIGWQQIIKRLPLTTAFANKAVTVVWGIIWGVVFFGESVTVKKIIGAALVIAGVVMYSYADKDEAEDKCSAECRGDASGEVHTDE